MQIVSEAVYERLRETPQLYASTHNKIVYLTAQELTVRHVEVQARSALLKLKSFDVVAFALQPTQYLAVLYAQGLLEVRRLDRPSELVLAVKNIAMGNGRPYLRVSSEAVYILSGSHLERIGIKKGGRERIQLQERRGELGKQMAISGLLEGQKLVIVAFESFLSLRVEGFGLRNLDFKKLDAFILLNDPRQLTGGRQYLIVVAQNRWLRVYDLLELRVVSEIEIFIGKNEKVSLRSDPLNEYLILTIWDHQKKNTIKNSLLKVNRQVYRKAMENSDLFFLFDIEVGLQEDLLLFPTHPQTIRGTRFDSVDMIFFRGHQIRIATLIIQSGLKTKVHQTQRMAECVSVPEWTQALSSLMTTNTSTKHVEPEKDNDEWDWFVAKFISDNRHGMRTDLTLEKQKKQKCLDFSFSRQRQKNQHQDALNTLSGSSSFRSLGSNNQEMEEKILRLMEGQISSNEGQKKPGPIKSKEQLSEDDGQDSEDSIFGDEQRVVTYLSAVETEVLSPFLISEEVITNLQNNVDRFQSVHGSKLQRINRLIREKRRQTQKFDKIVIASCTESLQQLKRGINAELKGFASVLGKLEILSTRSIKRMKRGYRDFLSEELQVRQEKLEESEESGEKIDLLVNQL